MVICGVDEAGRGSIAGGLYMAGVILKGEIQGLKDSKQLSQKKRFLLEKIIKESHIFFIVHFAHHDIDKYGLSHCLHNGLNTIHAHLKADKYLFDGNNLYGASQYQAIIKGDQQIAEIKAASILAKCAKDTEMQQYSMQYPHYGFEKHCGYGTKQHIEAIKQYGLLPIHRKSFHIKSLT